jgi:hypothetical protein
MALERIEYGALASSKLLNDNFEYLDNRISSVADNLASESSGIYSNIASMNSSLTQADENLASDISDLETNLNTLRNEFDSVDLTPKYTNAVTVVNSSGGGSYNINWNGWLAFDLYCNANSARYQFYINNVMVGATASDEGDRAAGIVMVKSGSVATWNGSQSIVIKKIPFVGG